MSKDIIKPNKGVALILASLFGPFGADKFYVGAKSQGVIQLILSLTIIGLFVSIPWAFISTLGIVIAILYSSSSVGFGYPNVEWAPQKDTDKYIAYTFIGLFILSSVVSIFTKTRENFEDKDKDKKKQYVD